MLKKRKFKRKFITHQKKTIIGYRNAKVENKAKPNIGKSGLGIRNKAVEQVIGFSEVNNLLTVNICFRQPKRQPYMWISPDSQYRNK